jgi:hypothetical protein
LGEGIDFFISFFGKKNRALKKRKRKIRYNIAIMRLIMLENACLWE